MMTGSPKESLRPTRPGERIRSLDLLRGFALLGILTINIQVFSMISAAYLNPTAYGDLSGVNGWVYILSHVLADQKFMTLFYGHGFGLFGSVERTLQVGIVLAVWIVQLIASSWWVKRFRCGPVEWVWRSLTYGQLQPIR